MAKLPKRFDWREVEIRGMLSEGREQDGRTALVEILSAGEATPALQALAADLIKPAKRRPGRRKEQPKHWYDIGSAFDEARSDGVTYEEAIAELSERFGFSEAHIKNAIRFYEQGRNVD